MGKISKAILANKVDQSGVRYHERSEGALQIACEEAAGEERDDAGAMDQLRSLRRVMVSCLTFVGKPCFCAHTFFCGGATRRPDL